MEWVSLGNGLQYRKHRTRKHGVRFDRYFRGRYTIDGKTTTFGLGWESHSWTQSRCLAELIMYKENAKKGVRPRTPKEKREIEDKKRKAQKDKIKREKKKKITFGEYFQETYYPAAKASKKTRSYQLEYAHFKSFTWIR